MRRLLGGRRNVAAALAAYLEFLRQREDAARPVPRRPDADQVPAGRIRAPGDLDRPRAELDVGPAPGAVLGGCFDPVVCGDDLSSHKPDPEGLLAIIRLWRLKPKEVMFVGDSDQDLAGGHSAGVPTVAIGHGRRIAPEFLRHLVAVTPSPLAAYARVRQLLSRTGRP